MVDSTGISLSSEDIRRAAGRLTGGQPMRRGYLYLVLAAAMIVAWPKAVCAQGGFEQITGKDFDRALPKDFYLEGNAIPTEKRNAALVKTPAGARVLFALIDTAGYSSQIRQKYIGMAIAEGKVTVCTISLKTGSYGFGVEKAASPASGDAKFFIYNQAGEKVGDCIAKRDNTIKQPKPLALDVSKGKPAELMLGRYVLELK
jgi:hypothetical protein